MFIIKSLIISASLALGVCFAQGSSQEKSIPPAQKEKLIGNILKNTLETYHYKKLKVNDDVSIRAFDNFLKKIDYSKIASC